MGMRHLHYGSQAVHVSLQRVEALYEELFEQLEALAVDAAHHLHTWDREGGRVRFTRKKGEWRAALCVNWVHMNRITQIRC